MSFKSFASWHSHSTANQHKRHLRKAWPSLPCCQSVNATQLRQVAGAGTDRCGAATCPSGKGEGSVERWGQGAWEEEGAGRGFK